MDCGLLLGAREGCALRESACMEPPAGWGPVAAAAALGAAAATCLRPAESEPADSSSPPTAPLPRSGSSAAQQRWKKLASMSKERAALRKAAASASPRWRELVATEMLGSKWGRLGEEHRALMLAADGEEVELEEQGFRKGDVLVVVDMQNDFIPGAEGGGRLGTSEGKQISPLICDLIAAAAAGGARVVATRDYHPRSHCSFDANGGPFPVHCVQGCPGSHFFPPIAEALDRARKERTPPHPPGPARSAASRRLIVRPSPHGNSMRGAGGVRRPRERGRRVQRLRRAGGLLRLREVLRRGLPEEGYRGEGRHA